MDWTPHAGLRDLQRAALQAEGDLNVELLPAPQAPGRPRMLPPGPQEGQFQKGFGLMEGGGAENGWRCCLVSRAKRPTASVRNQMLLQIWDFKEE